jgi:hypothetical protein
MSATPAKGLMMYDKPLGRRTHGLIFPNAEQQAIHATLNLKARMGCRRSNQLSGYNQITAIPCLAFDCAHQSSASGVLSAYSNGRTAVVYWDNFGTTAAGRP